MLEQKIDGIYENIDLIIKKFTKQRFFKLDQQKRRPISFHIVIKQKIVVKIGKNNTID